MASPLGLRFTVHLKLVFVYGMQQESRLIFPHIDIQLNLFLKRLSFSPTLHVHFCHRPDDCILWVYIPGLSSMSLVSLCQCLPVLISEALISGNVNPLSLFKPIFLLCISQCRFQNHLSISKRKCGILRWLTPTTCRSIQSLISL